MSSMSMAASLVPTNRSSWACLAPQVSATDFASVSSAVVWAGVVGSRSTEVKASSCASVRQLTAVESPTPRGSKPITSNRLCRAAST